MVRATVIVLATISLAFAIGARSSAPTASAAGTTDHPPVVPMETPEWLCCDYECTMSSGQSHHTAFCHPSSISTDCPNQPAPNDDAQQCVLVSQQPAEGCEDCVTPSE
jgi:hypothetical protein